MATYITRIFRIFGVIPETTDIGFPIDASGDCANKEELLMPYLTALANFREDIRNMARVAKNIDILKECDRIRDEVLPKLGVRLEDRANQTTVKLEDPEVLERERLEKEEKIKQKEALQKIAANNKQQKQIKQQQQKKKNEKQKKEDKETVETQ